MTQIIFAALNLKCCECSISTKNDNLCCFEFSEFYSFLLLVLFVFGFFVSPILCKSMPLILLFFSSTIVFFTNKKDFHVVYKFNFIDFYFSNWICYLQIESDSMNVSLRLLLSVYRMPNAIRISMKVDRFIDSPRFNLIFPHFLSRIETAFDAVPRQMVNNPCSWRIQIQPNWTFFSKQTK